MERGLFRPPLLRLRILRSTPALRTGLIYSRRGALCCQRHNKISYDGTVRGEKGLGGGASVIAEIITVEAADEILTL